MLNSNNIEIHEAAFVSSAFHATDVNLSKDVLAHLWSDPKIEKFLSDFPKHNYSPLTIRHVTNNTSVVNDFFTLIV